jgi:hypothetical protein
MPCPTITSRPPTGRAAAAQHGHVAGRASAHVGIRAIQDLIPSALATNLSMLRVCSMGAKHDGGGPGPAKRGPLRRSLLRAPPSTSAATRWPSRPARPSTRGERLATILITTPTDAGVRCDEHREPGPGDGYTASATWRGNRRGAAPFRRQRGDRARWPRGSPATISASALVVANPLT